jgi:hypothetical protein
VIICRACGRLVGEAEPGDHVIQATLQERHQGIARVARPAAGQLEILAELPLEDP